MTRATCKYIWHITHMRLWHKFVNLSNTVRVTVNFKLWITLWRLCDRFGSLKVTFSQDFVTNDTHDAWHQNVLGIGQVTTSKLLGEKMVSKRMISKCCSLTKAPASQSVSLSVLSIHKRPTTTSTNFTFPVKGWRGMLDWVRTSEEKISVSRDALSIEQTGKLKQKSTSCNRSANVQSCECKSKQDFVLSRWQRCFCDRHCPLQKPCFYSSLPEVIQFICFLMH